MKNILKHIFLIGIVLFLVTSCSDDDNQIGEIVTPTNVQVSYEIVGQNDENPYGDGSGMVNFTASADNALTFQFAFGDGTTRTARNGKITYQYKKSGVNPFQVVVSAIGTGGTSSGASTDLEVFVNFSDIEAENMLAGTTVGDSKTWYWAANENKFVGLGPRTKAIAGGGDGFAYEAWWGSIEAFDQEKSCMYTDQFVFTRTENGIQFQMTQGPAFVPGTYAGEIGVDGDTCSEDASIPVDMYATNSISLFPSASEAATEGLYNEEPYRGTSFEMSNGGFLGWYVGPTVYDIIYITDTEMRVRFEQQGSDFAWYAKFQTTDPFSVTGFDELVWSEEFDEDGAPNAGNWNYELGNNNGWGNEELQSYTDSPENSFIENGILNIVAKDDGQGGYTSARLTTQDLFEFHYGRVEVRAKLPAAQGTWPAIWMLGANNPVVGWPQSGEIDIMEQSGQNKEEVFGTCHWYDVANGQPAMAGASTELLDGSENFHVYAVEWTETEIKFFVDNTLFFTQENMQNYPFNSDFFLILNLAMGGTLGGDVDPNFTQDAMQIDYVRVYQ